MALEVQFSTIPTSSAEWNRFFRGLTVYPDEETVTTITLDNNAVTNEKLRDSEACSVMGRSVNSSGDPADIESENFEVLRRRNNILEFGQIMSVESKAVSFTAAYNTIYLVDASSGGVTVTLPMVTDGVIIHVKKINPGTNNVIVSGTIDGYSSVELNQQYMNLMFVADATQWYLI